MGFEPLATRTGSRYTNRSATMPSDQPKLDVRIALEETLASVILISTTTESLLFYKIWGYKTIYIYTQYIWILRSVCWLAISDKGNVQHAEVFAYLISNHLISCLWQMHTNTSTFTSQTRIEQCRSHRTMHTFISWNNSYLFLDDHTSCSKGLHSPILIMFI